MVGHDALNVGTVVRIHLSENYPENWHVPTMYPLWREVANRSLSGCSATTPPTCSEDSFVPAVGLHLSQANRLALLSSRP